jgi:hypothetical protein
MSGGMLSTHSLLIAHQGATGGAEMHVSGSAEINISGDLYSSGIHLNEDSLFTVTGGHASIDLVDGLKFGGWNGQPGTHTLVYNIDGTGVSTINAESLDATELDENDNPSQNFLELNALPGIADGTYTLIHTIPGRDPTNNLQWITQTGDANFSALTVVDIAGDGSAGFDITVDYGTTGPQMGDVNLSTCVDDDDLSLLLANWSIGTTWGTGDLNGDLTVDDDDLSLLLANWGAGCSPAPEAVPEPATMLLLALGGLGALLRRR